MVWGSEKALEQKDVASDPLNGSFEEEMEGERMLLKALIINPEDEINFPKRSKASAEFIIHICPLRNLAITFTYISKYLHYEMHMSSDPRLKCALDGDAIRHPLWVDRETQLGCLMDFLLSPVLFGAEKIQCPSIMWPYEENNARYKNMPFS